MPDRLLLLIPGLPLLALVFMVLDRLFRWSRSDSHESSLPRREIPGFCELPLSDSWRQTFEVRLWNR